MPVENTVFISYRRANVYTARAVYQALLAENYEVFLDYNSIDNGSFERIILNQIKARAHFLLVLTPSTLERCVNPDDWVRREIETAIEYKRNIVPLLFDDFEFKDAMPYLQGKLELLPAYNAVRIYADYFEAGMERLISRFLRKTLETVLHPLSDSVQAEASEQRKILDVQPKNLDNLVEAEKLFEVAMTHVRKQEKQEAVQVLSDAIKLNPEYSDAFLERGRLYYLQHNLESAHTDLTRAIAIDPRLYQGFYWRAEIHHKLENWDDAIRDYSEAIRINPPFISAYFGRGNVYLKKGEYNQAIKDYEALLKLESTHGSAFINLKEAKRLQSASMNPLKRIIRRFDTSPDTSQPNTANQYLKRAIQRPESDAEGRIADFTAIIELDPDSLYAYAYRGGEYYHLGQFELALEDDTQVVKLSPNDSASYNNRAEVYFAMGLYQKAFADYKTGYQLNAKSQFIRAGMAITLHAVGRKDHAYKLWQGLIAEDTLFKSAKLVGAELRWHSILIGAAERLLTEMGVSQK